MADFAMTVLDIPDIDRGVGLAIVLQTPGGRTWLYDTGTGYQEGDGWQGDVNSGRDQIEPFLRERGILGLDGIIISHAHYDHFGGLLWLVDRVPIGRLIDNGYAYGGPRDAHYDKELADYEAIREEFKRRGQYQAAVAGDSLELDEALEVGVIAPPAEFFEEPHPELRPEKNPGAHYMLNSNSLMLRITHGKVVFLLPGDIEKDDQSRFLLPSVPEGKLRCDVLVAPGHGLHTAEDFVASTQPKVAVVSLFERWIEACSAREGFSAVGAEVYVTGIDGDVTVVSDGQGWKVVKGA